MSENINGRVIAYYILCCFTSVSDGIVLCGHSTPPGMPREHTMLALRRWLWTTAKCSVTK